MGSISSSVAASDYDSSSDELEVEKSVDVDAGPLANESAIDTGAGAAAAAATTTTAVVANEEEQVKAERFYPKIFVRTIIDGREERYRIRFASCLLDAFDMEDTGFITIADNIGDPMVATEDQRIKLSNMEKDLSEKVAIPVSHAPQCPMRDLFAMNQGIRGPSMIHKKMQVAVCVLPKRADGKYLLTKRKSDSSIFPSAWVFPGGHLESGESLFDSGVREAVEETGLNVDPVQCTPLCIWESVYPTLLSEGKPKSHHMVLFIEGPVVDPNPVVKLQEEEIEAAVWLSSQQLEYVVLHTLGGEGKQDDSSHNDEVEVISAAGGANADSTIKLSELCQVYTSESPHGVARGHLFAFQALSNLTQIQAEPGTEPGEA